MSNNQRREKINPNVQKAAVVDEVQKRDTALESDNVHFCISVAAQINNGENSFKRLRCGTNRRPIVLELSSSGGSHIKTVHLKKYFKELF